jgi:hypothetical protein
MKKIKPSGSLPTSFPSCGEVFRFLVNALDLRAWGDIYAGKGQKLRSTESQKQASELLSKWAEEEAGVPPSMAAFRQFLREQVTRLPLPEGFFPVFSSAIESAVAASAKTVGEYSTYLGRDETRALYGRLEAPRAIEHLSMFRALLRRLPGLSGPMVTSPLAHLLSKAWEQPTINHPLAAMCVAHYGKAAPDPSTFGIEGGTEWRVGKTRPSFLSLSVWMREHPRRDEVAVNFGLANLIEALAHALSACVQPNEFESARKLPVGRQHRIFALIRPPMNLEPGTTTNQPAITLVMDRTSTPAAREPLPVSNDPDAP